METNCSPLYEQRTLRYRAQGIAKSNMVKMSKRGTDFLLRKNPTVRAGFEPGTSRSPVICLTSRPPSPHVHVMQDFEYQNVISIFDFRHSDALWFRNQSNVLSPSAA